MPRCEDCNRFVSVHQVDPELDIILNHNKCRISIFGSVRLATCCSDCGAEIREAYEDFGQELGFMHNEGGCHGDLELLAEEAEADYRTEGVGRYIRHFYGANIKAKVVCRDCDATLEVEDHREVQASHMEPLY